MVITILSIVFASIKVMESDKLDEHLIKLKEQTIVLEKQAEMQAKKAEEAAAMAIMAQNELKELWFSSKNVKHQNNKNVRILMFSF